MEAGFCSADADNGVEVLESGCHVVCTAGRPNRWLGVRGRPGVVQGAFQFEIVVEGESLLRVGWSVASASRNLGQEAGSFGYGGTAMKSTCRKFEKYGEEFMGCSGAVISCFIDRNSSQRQTISYSLYGRPLGVAFELPAELADMPLFPAVCGKEVWSASCRFAGPFLHTISLHGGDSYQPLAKAASFLQAPAMEKGDLEPAVSGLCSEDADAAVKVSDSGFSVQCMPQKDVWMGVRGRPGVIRGAYQFDVRMSEICLLRVGWASHSSKRVIGNDARSFGYGGTAKKSTCGRFEDYGDEFKGSVGAVVTCLIDRTKREEQSISFCLNGRPLGVAFILPPDLVDVPLFPAICGKGPWQATYHGSELLFPLSGYNALAQAASIGDSVSAPPGPLQPPKGELITSRAHTDVLPGRRVVLHVLSGPWQGWHVCRVLEVDELGCYLRHEEDDFTENVPWSYISGDKFRMELLPGQPDVLKIDVDRGLTATNCLRKGTLRVCPNVGAGLHLSTCEAGYFVDDVESEPGQQELRKGFVIVAIEGRLLLGLGEDELERIFGDHYHDHAVLVSGPYHELKNRSFAEVREQALVLSGVLPPPSGLQRTRTEPPPEGLLRMAQLRVAAEGAGLELCVCEFGYRIDAVEVVPGQPGLQAGVVILAVGGMVLMGLDEDEIERRFGEAFADGASMVVGDFAVLPRTAPHEVSRELEKLLSRPTPSGLERTKTW